MKCEKGMSKIASDVLHSTTELYYAHLSNISVKVKVKVSPQQGVEMAQGGPGRLRPLIS